jgi:hypothetical protein
LTAFSGKKSLSGKVICASFCPAYRGSPVAIFNEQRNFIHTSNYVGVITNISFAFFISLMNIRQTCDKFQINMPPKEKERN